MNMWGCKGEENWSPGPPGWMSLSDVLQVKAGVLREDEL